MDFNCDHCAQLYTVPDMAVGLPIKCPHCGRAIVAGEGAVETPPEGARRTPGGLSLASRGGKGAQQRKGRDDAEVAFSIPRDMSTKTSGYKNISAWIWGPVAAIVATLLVHGVLVAISLYAKELPLWTLFYVPMIAGGLIAMGLFANDARQLLRDTLPVWIMIPGFAVCLGLAYGTSSFIESTHRKTIKKKVAATLYREFSAPRFATKNVPELRKISLGPSTGSTHPVTIVYSGDRSYGLSVVRHVAKIVQLTGIIEMKAKMAAEIAAPEIYECLAQYELLKDAKIDSLELENGETPGSYTGKLKVKPDLSVDIAMNVVKDAFEFNLSRQSDREVRAAPLVSGTWRELDQETKEHCTRVAVRKPIDDSHWQADAFLSNGKVIAIVIADERADADDEGLRIHLPAREAAIIQINKKIQNGEAFDNGKIITEKCINLVSANKLRNGQEVMRAMFVQSDSQFVLVNERGYSVEVKLGEWDCLTDYSPHLRRAQTPQHGWSLLLPARFVRQSQVKNESVVTSIDPVSKCGVSLKTRMVSEFSKFNLSGHVATERQAMVDKYSAEMVSDMVSVETASGLKGYAYHLANQTLHRARYFFVKGDNLAVVTFDLPAGSADPRGNADALVATLRHKDVVSEDI